MAKMYLGFFLVPVILATSGRAGTSMEAANANLTWHLDGHEAVLNLKINPDLKFNGDAPWKLSLTGPLVEEGYLEKTYDFSNFSKDKASFYLKLKKDGVPQVLQTKSKESKYTLVYFLCDKEIKWCKRIVKEGTVG